ncbi:hypothetical protein D3C81_1974310 [compost metagenome]
MSIRKVSVCRLPVLPFWILVSSCDNRRDSSWLVKRSRAVVPAVVERLRSGSSWSFCDCALLSR